MTGFSGNGEGGITQGATENIFSISNATSWVKGHHNIRASVIQAQFRQFEHLTEVPPRGGFTFNGQYTGNPVADFLLGYCSTCTGAFGSSRSTYTLADLRAVHRRQLADQPSLTLQMGIRWEYLGPWAEIDGIEGSFDAAQGKIGYHKLPARRPAAAGCRSSSIRTTSFPAGHPEEGPEQLGSARRPRVQRQRPDGCADRIRRLLRQPESQRAPVLASRAAVLRAVFAPADADGSQLECRHAVPGSEQHPAVPRAVLDGSDQPQRLHGAVERQRAALARPQLSRRSGLHRQAAATTSTSATTSTRRSPGRPRS